MTGLLGTCDDGLLGGRVQALLEADGPVSSATYAKLLQQCRDERATEEGKLVHSHMMSKSESASNPFLANMVVEMYAKCGCLEEASVVFESMGGKTLVSWNIVIAAFAQNGHCTQALEHFRWLLLQGVRPNKVTYLNTLQGCTCLPLAEGRQVHALICESGHDSDSAVCNSLINMYGKCHSLEEAEDLFHRMQNKDVVSWNSLLSAHARNGKASKVLELFRDMGGEGFVKPEKVTYLTALDACSSLSRLEDGKEIHRLMLEDEELVLDTQLTNALISMYGKCNSVEDAVAVFEQMVHRNVVTWTAMISAFSQNGYCKQAVELFRRMDREGVPANVVTLVSTLDACAGLKALEQGRLLHSRAVEAGLGRGNAILDNSILNLYASCGCVEEAGKLFGQLGRTRNVVAWNTMLKMLAEQGDAAAAVRWVQRMDQEGVKLDSVSYLTLMSVLVPGTAAAKAMLARVSDHGLESDFVVGNTVVSLHCRGGNIQEARKAFDKIKSKSVVSWTTMVCGYTDSGRPREALDMFQRMQQEGLEPDIVTYIGAVDACTSLAWLALGRALHSRVVSLYGEQQPSTSLANSLVTMYGRCGSLEGAKQVFYAMDEGTRDIITWNSMLVELARNGCGAEAVEVFGQMNLAGLPPDEISFLGVIFGCGNSGLLDDGHSYLTSMAADYGVVPAQAHFGCMVDVLSKAGWLESAESLIATMPFQPDSRAWLALLGGCKTQGDAVRGCRAARQLQQQQRHEESSSTGSQSSYVLLSSIYSGRVK